MALKSPFNPGSGQDYFEEAKQLSLNAFMQTALNAKPTARGQGGRHIHYSFCPSCGASTPQSTKLEVTDDRLYHCFACADAGSIIDAAAITWGCEPLEAAKRLVGVIVSPNQRAKPLPVVAPEIPDEHAELRRAAQRQVFPKIGVSTLIFAHRQKPEPEVLKYLTEDRGLSLPVIREAWCRQLIGFLPSDPHQCTELLSREIGQDLLVESGIWNPARRMPGIVGRPLVFFLPGLNSAEFRLARPEREGERKGLRYGPGNIPWFWRGTSGKTAVVEGMFDVLRIPGHRGHPFRLIVGSDSD
ncbi:hypothetical protein HAP94_24010 [Acidithiobacillus ferrivorans]|nr:hypothetical protein [Acidithiobacillus ferrivorans]